MTIKMMLHITEKNKKNKKERRGIDYFNFNFKLTSKLKTQNIFIFYTKRLHKLKQKNI